MLYVNQIGDTGNYNFMAQNVEIGELHVILNSKVSYLIYYDTHA